jgi:hypothetical protein
MLVNNGYGMGMIQTRICTVRIRKDDPDRLKSLTVLEHSSEVFLASVSMLSAILWQICCTVLEGLGNPLTYLE